MKIFRNFSRILVGIVFIFSGFVKVVDPYGSAYKFADYFSAMNLEFLKDFSLPFAIFMSVIELLVGLCLFFNLIPKISSWLVLIFMIFFTPLTLWLAIANPVTDCGCFGDALVITNWQTFFKNIILLLLAILIFYNRNNFKSIYSHNCQLLISFIFLSCSLILSVYCMRYLPILDFRPYHIGANIQEGMSIPESEKDNKDIFESNFIYEKDGQQKEFTIDNIPDKSWTFIDAKHVLIKEGYKPPIQNFSMEPIYIPGYDEAPESTDDYVNLFDAEFVFTNGEEKNSFSVDNLPGNNWEFVEVIYHNNLDPNEIIIEYLTSENETISVGLFDERDDSYIFIDATYLSDAQNDNKYGEDIKDEVLSNPNYTFLAIILNVSKTNVNSLDKLNRISELCQEKSYKLYCLTASNESEIKEFIDKYNPNYKFYNTDPITLKTIIRSNPGLVLLKEGTILNKWPFRSIPEVDKLQTNLSQFSITEQQKYNNKYIVYIYILTTLIFMLSITSVYYWLIKNRYINKH